MGMTETAAGSFIPVLLLVIELYLVVVHWVTLSGVRLVPRKDVTARRTAVPIEAVLVTCCSLYSEKFLWLALLHNVQHVSVFYTYNGDGYTGRVGSRILGFLIYHYY